MAIPRKEGRLLEERRRVVSETRERVVGYLLGAFGLVAGLAWNDAVRALIEYFLPPNRETVGAKFIYAAAITLVVVIVSLFVLNRLKKEEKPAA